MSEKASPLTLALERLTVFDVWKLLGLEGTAKPFCRSPFRGDRNPSFSIYDGGHRWKDHASGDGGDAADFVAKACGLSAQDAAKKLIELAGTGPKDKENVSSKNRTHHARAPRQKYDPFKDPQKAAKRQNWPSFEIPTRAEIREIAELRGLSPEGVTLALDHGLLFCADFPEGRAWVITDSRRLNAQARLFKGRQWLCDLSIKAKTLLGSVGSWPIGLREAEDFPAIALLEGGPDLLAAFHFLWLADRDNLIAPVAILGAANHLPQNALPYFKKKIVRIFQHDDADGLAAAKRWAAQLTAAGAEVDGFSFAWLLQANGWPVNDLNDFVRIHPKEWEKQRNLAESAFNFIQARHCRPIPTLNS